MNSKKRSRLMSETRKKMKYSSDLESDSDYSEIKDIEHVQIDVSGFELAPTDYNGIKLLLQQLFLKTSINISELTSFIIDQLDIGCVIKETEVDESCENNDEDTVFGVVSVVNLSQNRELQFINQLRSLILDLSKQHAIETTNNFLTNLFNEDSNVIGFLINERYSNLPPIISSSSFSSLLTEMKNKSEQDISFKFTHFIMICKLNKTQVSKKKKIKSFKNNESWVNTEDQIFDKFADARFEFCVKDDCDTLLSGLWTDEDVEMVPYRRLLVFSSYKLTDIVKEINDLVK